MEKKSVRLARYFLVQMLGALCIVIGIVGLVLPVLQGILFLCIGAMLIAMYNPSLHRFIHRVVEEFPFLESVFEKTEVFLEKFFGASPDGSPPIRSGFPKYKERHHEGYGHSEE